MGNADTRENAGNAPGVTDINEALRELNSADQVLDQLTADITADGEFTLDDLLHQINDLGDDCPPELRAARLEAEDAQADARQTLTDASASIAALTKHLKSLKSEL